MARVKRTAQQIKALSAIVSELKREIAEGDGVGVYLSHKSACEIIQALEEALAAKPRKRDGPANVDMLGRALELRRQSVPWRAIEKQVGWNGTPGDLKSYVNRNKKEAESALILRKLKR